MILGEFSCGRVELDSHLLPLNKTQVQIDQNLNIRPVTLEVAEEKLAKHFKTWE